MVRSGKPLKPFAATIYVDGRALYLGRFATRQEAAAVRDRALVARPPSAPRRAPTYITQIAAGWMAGRYSVNLPRKNKPRPFETLAEARAFRDEYFRSQGRPVPDDAQAQAAPADARALAAPEEPPFDVDSLFA